MPIGTVLNGRRARTPPEPGVTLLVIVLVVLGLIAVVAVLRRLGGGSRAEEHAIERHEHALGVLGDVSRRESMPSVKIVRDPEVAKIHIRPTEEGAAPVPRPSGEDVPPPRIRLEPPALPGVPVDAPLAFGTPIHGTPAVPPLGGRAAVGRTGDAADPEPATVVFGDDAGGERLDDRHSGRAPGGRPTAARGSGAGPRPPGRTPHGQAVRRRVTAGATVVFVAALAVAGVELSGGGGTPKQAGHSSLGRHHPPGAGSTTLPPTSTTAPSATTTTVPTTISPETTSASEVSYRAPATTYTVTFPASGPCWIGIQQVAGGPWLWEETVESGQSATYTATGAVVIRLGAPPVIKVAIDGITVQLPPSNVQPYDLTFTPSS
jgi:hypothetical protein